MNLSTLVVSVLKTIQSFVLVFAFTEFAVSQDTPNIHPPSSEILEAVPFELNDLNSPPDARAALAHPITVQSPNYWPTKEKSFFSVQELKCQSNTRISCTEVEQRLRSAGALSLWSLNKQRIGAFSFSKLGSSNSFNMSQLGANNLVRDILTENPWIEDASIEFSTFERSAKVTIQEAVPWFVTELRKSNWIVSRRGALLQEVNSIVDPTVSFEVAQLPRVRGIERQRGASVTREAEAIRIMTQFLGVVSSMSGLSFEVESFELLEDYSIAISPLSSKVPTVFVKGDSLEDSRAKLELLKRVLADSKARGELLQRVDLRFKGRAVVVKQPETTPLSKPSKLS